MFLYVYRRVLQKLIPYVFHFSYHFFDKARAELRPEFNCHQDAAGPMGPSLSGSFEGELLWKMWSLGRPKGGGWIVVLRFLLYKVVPPNDS